MKITAILAGLLLTVAAHAQFDHTHSAWNEILISHVDDKGLVDYKGILNQDQVKLRKYLAALGKAETTKWTREQKLAFYINAYNAFTVKAILDHYPIQASGLTRFRFPKNSIRQIPGVWDKLTFLTAGKMMTLEGIEHRVLRRILEEPRIHFAIVCASIGCPNLRNRAFTGANVNKELDEAAQAFIRNPSKVRLDMNTSTLHLSQIFKWFGKDFAGYTVVSNHGSNNGVVSFVAQYLPKDTADKLKSKKHNIEWLDYDWSLNEQ